VYHRLGISSDTGEGRWAQPQERAGNTAGLFVAYRRLQDGEEAIPKTGKRRSPTALLHDVSSSAWVAIDCLCPGDNEARPMGQQYKLCFLKEWGLLARAV
jgi:hypothetical protein